MYELEFMRSSDLAEKDLQSIYEIEQDLWARFLWEYIQCDACCKIHSKQDVYKDKDFLKTGLSIKNNTVAEIEKIFWKKDISCSYCHETTQHIFWKEYMNEMKMQFDFQESFISIQRWVCWKVLWFATSYISDFDTIYNREFEYYYKALGKTAIKQRLEGILEADLPKEILCFSAIWNRPEWASIKNLYELFKNMFFHIEMYNPELLWLYETVSKSLTHALLETCNTQRINTKKTDRCNVNAGINSDIFLHKNMAQISLNSLWENYKEYIKMYSSKLHETMK